MFDLGWSEMAVIMLVAIIVIGPKDLPKVARTVGKWTGKARAMARDFQRSLDEMAREAELDEIKKTVESANPHGLKRKLTSALEDTVDLDGRKAGKGGAATAKAKKEPAEEKRTIGPPETRTVAGGGPGEGAAPADKAASPAAGASPVARPGKTPSAPSSSVPDSSAALDG
ncbi:MAG: twin-arginine translocase subunit TatB [Geminicoccaceae bacterium]|nr:twin-arginine translocase subunit TatB [Geminicoccaceae bacterium]